VTPFAVGSLLWMEPPSQTFFPVLLFPLLVFLSLQAFFDLEATNQELKSDLKDLFINSAQ